MSSYRRRAAEKVVNALLFAYAAGLSTIVTEESIKALERRVDEAGELRAVGKPALYDQARSRDEFQALSRKVEAIAKRLDVTACEVVFTEERDGKARGAPSAGNPEPPLTRGGGLT